MPDNLLEELIVPDGVTLAYIPWIDRKEPIEVQIHSGGRGRDLDRVPANDRQGA